MPQWWVRIRCRLETGAPIGSGCLGLCRVLGALCIPLPREPCRVGPYPSGCCGEGH